MMCSILTPTHPILKGPTTAHPTHPQPLGMGGVGVRMLHIMLCIMLHVLDHLYYISQAYAYYELWSIVVNRNTLRTTFFAQVGIKSLKYHSPELSVHQST